MLKACALQLCGAHIFNMSLSLQRVPVLWKTSCLVPVPKTLCPSGSKDYRPVTLTFHIMTTLERLVLEQLWPIQPTLLGERLTVMQVDAPLVLCIVKYLTGRPQYVHLQYCVSDRVVSNPFPSPSTPWTSTTTQSPAIFRSSLMTLL